MRGVASLLAATVLGVASLGGSGYYLHGVTQGRLLSSTLLRQVVPVPAAMLPKGSVQQIAGRPLTNTDRQALRSAVWREPLNQQFANTAYVDAVTSRAAISVVDRRAQVLARLGWRNTPAQQNLLLRDAIAGRYLAVLDRGDALLRRQKLLAVANTMLAALETTPTGQALLVRRLLDRPAWRSDYFVATSQAAAPAFLLRRARTLTAIMDARSPIARREIAPVLTGLLNGGHGQDAVTLWTRFAGRQTAVAGNMLADAKFEHLRQADVGSEPSLPFEWQLESDLGSDVSTSSSTPGLEISWNGKGVPVFASQWIAVQPGRAYRLIVLGQANATTLAAMIRPTFTCGNRQVAFGVTGSGSGFAAFRSDGVPAGCSVVQFTLGAQLRDDAQPVSATLTDVRLAAG